MSCVIDLEVLAINVSDAIVDTAAIVFWIRRGNPDFSYPEADVLGSFLDIIISKRLRERHIPP